MNWPEQKKKMESVKHQRDESQRNLDASKKKAADCEVEVLRIHQILMHAQDATVQAKQDQSAAKY